LLLEGLLLIVRIGYVGLDFLHDRANTIVSTVEGLRCVVLVHERILLDRDLAVVARHHLCHFVFFDLFLSWGLRSIGDGVVDSICLKLQRRSTSDLVGSLVRVLLNVHCACNLPSSEVYLLSKSALWVATERIIRP
jgi:hypothetical protein